MLLESIHSPQDLKKLNLHQLNIVCTEIRSRIVDVVSKNGGHLASSLGAVELIVTLHYCLHLPREQIVFDVGHQALGLADDVQILPGGIAAVHEFEDAV